jgi:hypothetical protein
VADIGSQRRSRHADRASSGLEPNPTNDLSALEQYSGRGPIPPVHTTADLAANHPSASERAFESKLGRDDDTLKRAQHEVVGLDRQLGTELAQIGPGLTLTQKLDYVRQFRARADYRSAQRAFVEAGHVLTSDANGGAIRSVQAAAESGDSGATKQLLATYSALAESNKDGARTALAWASEAEADCRFGPHLAEISAIRSTAEQTFSDGVLADIQRMIASPAGEETLSERLTKASHYFRIQMELVRAIKLGNLPHVLREFELEVRSPLGAKETRRLLLELHGEDPMIKRIASHLFAFAGLGKNHVAAGGEVHALGEMQDAAHELMAALQGAKDGRAVLAQLRRFAVVARHATRLLPLLGVYGSGKATIDDVEAVLHNPNVTDIARTVGDFLQASGSALELAPPPVDLIGTALMSIGAAISVVTLFWQGPSQAQRDERDILGNMHFTHNQVSAYTGGYRTNDQNANSSGYSLARASKLGVSAQEIQHLAAVAPDLFSREGCFDGLVNLHAFLCQPAQGGLIAKRLPEFLQVCGQPAHASGFRTLASTLFFFGDVPIGPTAQQLGVLVEAWRILGRAQFAHLPDDQYRKWAGASEANWPHLLGA